MTLDDLDRLAEAATPGPWVNKSRSSSSSFSVLAHATMFTVCNIRIRRSTDAAMADAIYIVRAADAMRGEGYEPRPGIAKVQAYDAARAALDAP